MQTDIDTCADVSAVGAGEEQRLGRSSAASVAGRQGETRRFGTTCSAETRCTAFRTRLLNNE